MFTESVRLTDELALKEQTDEEGDLFNWIKHQAQQGVLSAQVKDVIRIKRQTSKGLLLAQVKLKVSDDQEMAQPEPKGKTLRERLCTHKVFTKYQCFYLDYHKFSIKSYVLDVY